jgi:hypothetical protein
VRLRELQAEFDKMEDRVRAESAQKADLQVRCPLAVQRSSITGQWPWQLCNPCSHFVMVVSYGGGCAAAAAGMFWVRCQQHGPNQAGKHTAIMMQLA